ncbi:MAG: amidase [Sphingomonas bacterium]|nr:amidase [Sphingomonas bacterium]
MQPEVDISGAMKAPDRRSVLAGGAAATLTLATGAAARPSAVANRITGWDACTLSRAIHRRETSCVEVMTAYLDRIERENPAVTAIVALQPRPALLVEAAARDRELAHGQSRGWMHGFPHAVKDLENAKGIVSSQGSPIYRDFVPTSDSFIAERLRRNGAILIGKTNVPEFGLGSQSYNKVYGTTLNAYDHSKTSGGSSGGASVAVALGMVPVADGSDYMGSLRNPTAFNNVFGLRPTIGRVARSFDSFLPSMGVMGPIARNVPDLAMLLSVMAGYDARDPFSLREDPARFTGSLDRRFAGTRIGWFGDYGGYLPFEDGVIDLCRHGLGALGKIGCTVETVKPPFDMASLWEAFVTIRAWQTAAGMIDLYRDPTKRALLKPEAIWEIERGMALSALDVSRASAVRVAWYRTVQRIFEQYDFVVTPSAQVFPFDAKRHWPDRIGERGMDTYHRWMEVVAPITMTGCPAINVPVGFNAAGLPMGMQIVGRHGDDFGCLQLAHAYDGETRLSRRTPPSA